MVDRLSGIIGPCYKNRTFVHKITYMQLLYSYRLSDLLSRRSAWLTIGLLALLLHAGPAAAALDVAACARVEAAGLVAGHAPVGCDRLAVVRFPYVDFSGARHVDGEIMVLAAVAPEVGQLFHALYQRRFPLARARLIEHYQGDDNASMQDNNTSAFNNRQITGGGPPSLHAYGLAIDINPLQNPYVQPDQQGAARFSPPAGVAYMNRLAHRPGKQARPGMAEPVVRLFAQYGFTVWGGYWDTPVDYQHFQFGRSMAERLAALPEVQARALFLRQLDHLRKCLRQEEKRMSLEIGTSCALN